MGMQLEAILSQGLGNQISWLPWSPGQISDIYPSCEASISDVLVQYIYLATGPLLKAATLSVSVDNVEMYVDLNIQLRESLNCSPK